MLAILVTPVLALPAAAQGDATLHQLLEGISAAQEDPSARDRLGTYLRSVITAAQTDARGGTAPRFCVEPGQGRFDAGAFRRYAIRRIPSETDQHATLAAPVILDFLSETYPCR